MLRLVYTTNIATPATDMDIVGLEEYIADMRDCTGPSCDGERDTSGDERLSGQNRPCHQ